MARMDKKTAVERLKDGVDCQVECARNLKSLMRAFPQLSASLTKAIAQMDEVKETLKVTRIEIDTIPFEEVCK